MKHFPYMLLVLLFLMQCRNKKEYPISAFPGKPEVPASIKKEHNFLLEQLRKISTYPDSTGAASIKVLSLAGHHFQEEEDYVLPALGVLPFLASGKIPEQDKKIIALIERLKENWTHMIAEHQLIHAYLDELELAAANENHPEVAALREEIQRHAGYEEEIFFPTAIVIGEYLKLKSQP